MTQIHNLLLYIHIFIGFASLVLFWIPIVAKKGGTLHVRAGRWYANAMYAVSITAFVMSIMVLIHPMGVRFSSNDFEMGEAFRIARQERMTATFLLAISILVFSNVRHGLLTLRAKRDHSLMRSPIHLGLNGLLTLMGVVLIFVGMSSDFLLFYIFAGICLVSGITQLRYSLKRNVKRMEWVIAHLGAMCGAGIGSYTAFFVFGGNQYLADLLTGNLIVIPWITPAIIGTAIITLHSRKYRKQFNI